MHIMRLDNELKKVDAILNDFLTTINHDLSGLIENIWIMRDNMLAINTIQAGNYDVIKQALSMSGSLAQM